MKKRYFLCCFFMLAFSGFTLQGEEKLRMAVMELTAEEELSGLASICENQLMETVIEAGNYSIVERGRIREVAEELYLQNTSDFSDEEALDIGYFVGADTVLFGSLTQLGQRFVIAVRAVQVETGLVELAKQVTAASEDELLEAMRSLAYIISGKPDPSGMRDKGLIVDDDSLMNDDVFVANYIGVDLGASRSLVEGYVRSSGVEYKSYPDQIVVYGDIVKRDRARFTVFNFRNGRLNDAVIFEEYPFSERNSKFIEIKYELKSIFRDPYTLLSRDMVVWKREQTELELSVMPGAREKVFIYFHYYLSREKKEVEESLSHVVVDTVWFKRAVETAVGGELVIYPGSIKAVREKSTAVYKFSLLFAVPFSFSFYPHHAFSVGFSTDLGYKLNIFRGFTADDHDLYFDLAVRHTMGKASSAFKGCVEYGAVIMGRFFLKDPDRIGYLLVGPIFQGGFCWYKKSFLLQCLFSVSLPFGKDRTTAAGEEIYDTNFGITLRFQFYKRKVLK